MHLEFKLSNYIYFLITLIFLGFTALSAAGQTGTIKGTIIDKETQSPVMGANVFLKDNPLGAATDEQGNYTINDVPVGSYVLQVSFIGYEPLKKTDVIVKPDHISYINAALQISALETEAIVVNGGYFNQS